MKWISILCLTLLMAITCHAAEPTGLSADSRNEVARRGNMVVQTGTIQGELIAAALAPPADDSDKWFITLVGKEGEAGFETMKKTITTDPAMRPWVDAGDAARSHMVFHIKRIDDGSQKDWIATMREAIDKGGLPAVLLQPPRNGKYGESSKVVKAIHGVVSGTDLAEKLRDAAVDHVQTFRGLIGQADDNRGVAPPFNVPKQDAPKPPATEQPFEVPPAKLKPLTAAQIKEVCPGATASFLYDVMSAKETNLEMVQLRWLALQEKIPHPDEPVTNPAGEVVRPIPLESEIVPARPFSPAASDIPDWLLVALGFLLAVSLCTIGVIVINGIESRKSARIVANRSEPLHQIASQQIDALAKTAKPGWMKSALNANDSGSNE